MRALRLALNVLLWPPVFLTATFCALAAVAAQWGRVSLQWDVAAQFAPVWLTGSALCLVASAVFRRGLRWSVAAISLVGLVCAAALIMPELLRSTGPRAGADARDQLKIVQFNVWHDNHAPKPILDWLDAERPDIVVIEENSSRFAQAASAPARGWSVACARCEVMVLSRRPTLYVARGGRNPHAPPTPLTRVGFRDRYGVFEVIGVHNAWPTDRDQPFQERRLATLIASRPRERLIVTGDFNSTPWSFQRRRWDQAFGLTRRDRAIASWPARNYERLHWLGLPFLPIDHVYAGPGWATVSVRRGPRLNSDHYPLVLTLAPLAPR
jgi:endonuclease/exonuclease/phosphatase (EEP) superfamily protein YafD